MFFFFLIWGREREAVFAKTDHTNSAVGQLLSRNSLSGELGLQSRQPADVVAADWRKVGAPGGDLEEHADCVAGNCRKVNDGKRFANKSKPAHLIGAQVRGSSTSSGDF